MAKEPVKKNEKKENKNFFKEFRAELKRVSWPTPKQLVNNTAVVIGIVILVAVIVFVLDVIFENLNNFGVERLKALVTSSSEETVEATVDDAENTQAESETTEGTETAEPAEGAENTAEDAETPETSEVENSVE